MSDPKWVYGLPIDLDSLNELAAQKAPECVCEDDLTMTSIFFIERYERLIEQPLSAEMCFDVFDDNLEPILVLVLHEEHFGYSGITLEDEDFLRKELKIKEKGKWYRYLGAFSEKQLDYYKKRVIELGTIPSRNSAADTTSNSCSSDVKQLKNRS
ncbi:hypothetical protein SCHPADRAFT_930406 [Schizopora paradoxa]|uniref:Uncharacterized protein n=1 Tax=Schizopora paradoxa TaxID=27342 RepID=A0A0H2S0V3_9AGAM|nr:hypothetical protein SCHPADRAFT_930406 [Schizopora paradoxa]